MKKTLCVIIAVIIALSSMTVIAFADAPNITMTADKTNVKPGDIITVTVKVAEGSNLCSATLHLIYDKAFFELVSFTPTDALTEFSDGEVSKDKPTYAGVHTDMLTDEAVLFTAQFKVLKRGGTIAIETSEVCYLTSGIVHELIYAKDEVNENLKKQTITITCPHTEKTTTTTNPTCSKEGKKVETCKECGLKTETTIAKLPHDMKDAVIKEATCTETGIKGKKCTVCGYTSDEAEIPMIPHDIKEVVIKEATCEEAGKKVEQCKNCDYKGKETDVPAKGHVEGRWEIVKIPTKTEPGLEQKKCTVCGHVMESREIPAAISYKKGDVNEDGHVTAVDARLVLQNVAELKELTTAQRLAADTNGDGKVTAVDARIILQYVAGLVKF